jgi:nucleoside-diphosphate-sugar epimerase
MSKTLVMGGTGAIGVYLVPELLRHNHEVHVTTRSDRKCDNSQCRYICGDARSAEFTSKITSDTKYDAIIDLMSYGTSDFRRIHGILLNRTEHYLFVSSYRVFADTGTTPITERSARLLDVCDDKKYLATDEYALAKARQEDILRASGRSNWTILRPCITYSRGRFQFGTLEANTICYRALQNMPVIMAREILPKSTTMTWAGDVARLIAKLVLNGEARGEDFNVVTSEHHTWAEVASYYREFIGLEVVETDLEVYTKVVGAPYQVKYDRLFHRILDNSKVLRTTGVEQSEFVTLREGLKRELYEFKRNPYFQYPDISVNARMDKVARSRISLKGLGFRERMRYYAEQHCLLRSLLDARAKLIALLERSTAQFR